MSDYTTGELARLCGVTVRTVQFYDARGLLHPTDLSEGGRRLYSDGDLRKMRMICALKTLGLSLDSISGVLASEKPERVLLLLLEEQEHRISDEQGALERQKRAVETVRETIRTGQMRSIQIEEHLLLKYDIIRPLKTFILSKPCAIILVNPLSYLIQLHEVFFDKDGQLTYV